MYKSVQVNKSVTMVQDLPDGESEWEYHISKGVKLSLFIVASGNVRAEAHLTVRLRGIGATAIITGLVFGEGEGKVVLHTMQVHERPETTSDLLVKTVLRDKSLCLYDGGIRVEKDAQKTNAYQRNENLLLSGRAYTESKPSLEILANDVRCTHGATAGPIDPDQLWYLESRGIGKEASETLIADGFIRSALSRINDTDVRKKLEARFTKAV